MIIKSEEKTDTPESNGATIIVVPWWNPNCEMPVSAQWEKS